MITISNLTSLVKTNNGFENKNEMNVMKSTDYSKLSLHEQILLRPSMYIGSISKTMRTERILKNDEGKLSFIDCEMDLPYGVERLFFEILYNATDNVINSREKKHDIGQINITMDKKSIKLRNGGVPIPVEMHQKYNMWTPSLIFGELLVSATYEKKKRTGIGMNGYGSKLTDIFSKEFTAKVGDPYNKREFSQRFSNNMLNKDEPIITENYTGEPYVEITYFMDFERFGYTEYPDYVFNLYAAYAAEASFASKVPIIFNNLIFNFPTFRDFAKLIVNNDNAKYIIHYEYPEGTEVKQVRNENGTYTMIAVDKSIQPITEVCILDTPHEAKTLSFVNSANTKQGGIHVEAVYDEISKMVIENIHSQFFGSKDNKKGTSRKFTLSKADLKRHMTVIISCWLPDPDCGAQEKVKLAGYVDNGKTYSKVSIKFNEKVCKTILDWDLVNQLYIDLEAKVGKLNETKGKKSKRQITGTIQDAYYAGSDKSLECVLYRTEGKSAMGYAYTMKSELSDEKMQYVGISCERGKPMNVMNSNLFRILKSKKYQELYDHLGLTEGMDYTIDENFQTLRYGVLAILTDADVDGKHITSLLLNIFYCRFRTLLQRPFIVLLRTPIMRVNKGNQVFKFYSIPEYEKWTKITPNYKSWHHKYYKGLATSNNGEIADDTKNPRIANFIYDDTTPETMRLAFDKELSDKRKEWISNYKIYDGIEEISKLPISDFINFEAVQYAVTNLGRSLPRFDGLKQVQRKSIYASKVHWKNESGNTMKVNRLSSMVAEKTNYLYGEKSIIDTITRMALSFAGTNNLPYFIADGQFGTRNDDGNDAGDARYIKTAPEFFWNYIFRPEDSKILQYIEDEDQVIEPEVFYPIIPMCMVNGALGIGTGSSTFIPNFNVIDIIETIKSLINETKLPKLVPYYHAFMGKITLENREKKTKKSNEPAVPIEVRLNDILKNDKDIEDTDDSKHVGRNLDNPSLADLETNEDGDILGNDETNEVGSAMLKVVTTGLFEIIDFKKLIITELPIGRSIKQYEAFLKELMDNKEIKDYKNLSKHDRPRFEVYGYGSHNTLETLHLIRSFSMTNMVLLTNDNRPIKFKDQYDLIKKWFDWRLPIYERRKQYLIKEKYEDIIKQQTKLRFTVALIEGTEKGYIPGQTILIMKQKKAETLRQMAEMNIPVEYLNAIKGTHFLDDDGISKLQIKINKLIDEYKLLGSISATQMWLNDIAEFKEIYLRKYPNEKTRVVFYD